MIYQKIILQLVVKDFDPAGGFAAPQAEERFHSDLRDSLVQTGWRHIPMEGGYPLATRGKENLILSPMGLRGMLGVDNVHELEDALYQAGIGAGELTCEPGRYTDYDPARFQEYLELCTAGIRTDMQPAFACTGQKTRASSNRAGRCWIIWRRR